MCLSCVIIKIDSVTDIIFLHFKRHYIMIFETKLYYNVMHSVILPPVLVPKIAHFMKSVTSFIFISLFASMKLYHLPIQTSLQYDIFI